VPVDAHVPAPDPRPWHRDHGGPTNEAPSGPIFLDLDIRKQQQILARLMAERIRAGPRS
jgi:hypothetical protein